MKELYLLVTILVSLLLILIILQFSFQSPANLPRLSPEVIKTRVTKLLEKATPTATVDTLRHIVKEIAQLIARVETPTHQNSPLTDEEEQRAVEKIFLCRSIMTYLRDKTPTPVNLNCRKCVSYPDTRGLLVMLERMDEKVAGDMDNYIGRVLVNTTYGLQCMPRDGKDWIDYKINLDINIGRLNLRWD